MSDLASVRDSKESIERARRPDEPRCNRSDPERLCDDGICVHVGGVRPYARLACPLDGFSMSGTRFDRPRRSKKQKEVEAAAQSAD
jgi:hypothetical protein